MAEVSAGLLQQAEAAYWAAFDQSDLTLHGIEAVVRLAYAAGQASAFEGGETEWSPRYRDGSPFLHGTFTEGGARRYVEEGRPGGLALFSRRVAPWAEVPDADR